MQLVRTRWGKFVVFISRVANHCLLPEFLFVRFELVVTSSAIFEHLIKVILSLFIVNFFIFCSSRRLFLDAFIEGRFIRGINFLGRLSLELRRVIIDDRTLRACNTNVFSSVSVTQPNRLLSSHGSAIVHRYVVSLLALFLIIEDVILQEYNHKVAGNKTDDATCHVDDGNSVVLVCANLSETLNLAHTLDDFTLRKVFSIDQLFNSDVLVFLRQMIS